MSTIWVDGLIGGKDIWQSLKTRDWQKASDHAREWDARNSIEDPESKHVPITISVAWEHFIRDAEARELVPDTLRKYKQLDRLTREFAEQKGVAYLRDFTVDTSRSFRATWTLHNSAAAKRLDCFKAFFRFCQDVG